MFAVAVDRAGAGRVDHQQRAFGRLAQANGLTVNVTARAFASGDDRRVAGLDDPDAVLYRVATATLQALFLESADPGRCEGFAQGRRHKDFISPEFHRELAEAQGWSAK